MGVAIEPGLDDIGTPKECVMLELGRNEDSFGTSREGCLGHRTALTF